MEFLTGLLSQFPWLGTVLMVLGAIRVIVKPLMAAFQSYVEYTPSESDNALFLKVKDNPIYKGIVFVLDYLGSVKLPGAK